MYILIIESMEAKSTTGSIVTKEGQEMIVMIEPEGWVEATSRNWNNSEEITKLAKTFDSIESATNFANNWKGHPWYCKPNGKFKIIEVKKYYKPVFDFFVKVQNEA